MANRSDISISVPAALADKMRALADERKCTPAELLGEALNRYEEVDRLNLAIESGQDRSEALDDFLMEQVNRMIHEYRAERRASAIKSKPGERRAS
jgi:metal-responsive CopG/Arc/MetJ family transcriptional regulator